MVEVKIVLILVALVPVLGACGGGDGGGATGSAVLTVAAGLYPLAEAARQVGGARVEVVDLTPPGVEPHDLELTSDVVDTLLDADLVVLMGSGFQPAVEDTAADREGPTLAVLDPEGEDPHVWLDPTRLDAIVDDVAVALADLDPRGRPTYVANAAAYGDRLAALDAELAAGLRTCERREIVTAHDSFGWLAARYDLEQHAIAGVSPDQEPDPRRIAELEDLVRTDGLTTVFTEQLVSAEVGDALARQAEVVTAVLDPLESQPATGDYLSAMRRNLTSLREALACT